MGGGWVGGRDLPRTLREYSITAACIPRQIPRKGMCPSLAHRIAPTYQGALVGGWVDEMKK